MRLWLIILLLFREENAQRLALARVLLLKTFAPAFLHEATSSLDAENETAIMEVLEKLKEKVTVVFVTHRGSLLKWFDSVIRL